jgi:flagellar biosynthesis protein FliQ
VETHPEKLESGVRRWLAYIALLIAAGAVIGDLVSFLTSFFEGELTLRFVLKVLTVMVIASGVFWYYLGSLKRDGEHVEA